MDGRQLGVVPDAEGQARRRESSSGLTGTMGTPTGGEFVRRLLIRLGPIRVWLFVGAVAVLSALVWRAILGAAPQSHGEVSLTIPWWQLAAAFYLAEVFVVHLQFRKQAHSLSLTEAGLVLGLFFASPANLLAAQVVGAGVALSLHRRQRPTKLAFNLAQMPLCTGVALLIFHSLANGGPESVWSWVVVLFAVAVGHTIGIALVSAVIAVAEVKFAAPQLPQTLAASLIGALATASLGLAAVLLIEHQPMAGLLLVVPGLACIVAFRAYMGQREQLEHLEFLYESMRETQGTPEFGRAITQLLLAARRLLRAEYAEIHLFATTPSGLALRSTSHGTAETVLHPQTLTQADEVVVKRIARASRPLLFPRRRRAQAQDEFLTNRGLGDGIVGVLRGEKRVIGFLVVGNRAGDIGSFTESDRELFETFSGHASVLLENSRLEQSLARVTELQAELRHSAYHDALTGLPNRVLFTDQVTKTLARDQRSHAVLFLDLDHFKNINDSWGHAAGDELLTQVAARLSNACPDGMCARLGGDEFAFLLEDTDAAEAQHATRQITDSLGKAFPIAGKEVKIHVSIGIAMTGPHASTAEELIRNADIAMYAAKQRGHGRSALYEHVLHSRLRQRSRLALELEHAVDRGELVAHYQPVVSLADGTIRAFEALVRWPHPERGLLAPGDFLDAAEESGLIVDVGRCVLSQAFASAQGWRCAFPHAADIGIWVNLAPSELTNHGLVGELADALTRTGLDPRRLTLEITESSMNRDEQGVVALDQLRELGVRISIDDFGTGYSSLSRLAELPIDMIKIPKTFIDQLAEDNANMVDAILRLAGSLNLATVAEGIEHASQAVKVRGLGCEFGQGYLFGKPIPAEEVIQLLRAERTLRSTCVPEPPADLEEIRKRPGTYPSQVAADAAA
jgi:diguanylate cyclase (GGDEF)-like protein